MKEAGAASGVIYRWLGVNDFPQDVRDGIKRATDAKFHKYEENKSYVYLSLSLSQNTENEHTTTESSTLSDRTFVRRVRIIAAV